VSAGDVTVVAGQPGSLRELSLREYLQRIGVEGGYARLEEALDLSHETLDSKCSIRFQTTFLPVPSYDATMEFATSAYNYNTTSDDCPKNLVLLCTTQGTAVQQASALSHTIGCVERQGPIEVARQ
jgi:huntingtin